MLNICLYYIKKVIHAVFEIEFAWSKFRDLCPPRYRDGAPRSHVAETDHDMGVARILVILSSQIQNARYCICWFYSAWVVSMRRILNIMRFRLVNSSPLVAPGELLPTAIHEQGVPCGVTLQWLTAETCLGTQAVPRNVR